MNHVIIGNGIAGIQAAETIRNLDPSASITLVAAESHPPYCRPMISLMLEGQMSSKMLAIRNPHFHEDLCLQTISGKRVTDIDVDSRTVRINDDRLISFDRLLIASGADPRPLKIPGHSLKNIFYMRTISHVEQMLMEIGSARHALVLGGGLVGFKAAYSMMRRNIPVTMLISSEYPLSMQVDDVAGRMILDKLKSNGLTVRTGIDAVAFEGDGIVREAHLSDGSILPCDRVIVGKGVRPAVGFIPTDRIPVDLGVLVNTNLQTGIPGIYAAGDVAECTDRVRQRPWINAIWPEAVMQGRIAGMNMAGRPVAYPGSLGRNVIRIFDLDVMTAGIVNPENDRQYQTFNRIQPRIPIYRKFVLEDNRLVGFILINRIETGGNLVSLIQRQLPLTDSDMGLLKTI
ncbi:MAG TPA: FAD-dependent oxidoreductase [Desulfatirhabdiaceae bacterium]|nr:FAD-dependent oxidoreductase [Desulfatirhabdiaceae bacterium]